MFHDKFFERSARWQLPCRSHAGRHAIPTSRTSSASSPLVTDAIAFIKGFVEAGKPVLAICVGMQALLSESEEFGLTPGLGISEGQVRRFPDTLPASTTRLKVPHMGWNQLQQQRACPLLAGIPDGAFAYFVHSYYAAPKDADAVVATTDYGVEFASVLWCDHLYATQFHPEKSQHWGLRILQNFFALSQGTGAR